MVIDPSGDIPRHSNINPIAVRADKEVDKPSGHDFPPELRIEFFQVSLLDEALFSQGVV